LGPEALSVKPGFLLHGVILLELHQMNLRVGKIIEPTSVIEVQMRQHNVAHIGGRKTELLYLPHSGHVLTKIGA
ncbi:MAG: hypothetical protein JWP77_2472, partial [Polaromonas sp.]|nr:hypothetical protein [Polaromonas sp.]